MGETTLDGVLEIETRHLYSSRKALTPTASDMFVAWDALCSRGLAHDSSGAPRGLGEVWARWRLLSSELRARGPT